MKYTSKSIKETEQIVLDFLKNLKVSKNGATVVLLEGDLGSGKTTFVQALARELGIKNHITSPTFVLMKKYKIPRKGISSCVALAKQSQVKNLIHIDAYRLNSGQDLLNLGWGELVSNPSNLIVVEWPEKVSDLWDGSEQKINFKFIDEKTRKMSYT